MMSDTERAALLHSATEAATAAGRLVQRRISSLEEIRQKPDGIHNLVTEMDIAAEELIKKIITERHPGSVFLAEESGGNPDLGPLTWVVDPIDGTVNYAHGIPIYCVSIAAVVENEPVVGVIYHPSTGELFTAIKGGGAFLNGVRLTVSTTSELSQAILVTGFPYNVAENPYGCIDSFMDFMLMGIPIRRLGSAALDLAYTAAGRFDAFWEVNLNAWDVAAGALMLTEAGGKMGTYSGNEPTSSIVTDRMLASNGLIDGEMMEVLSRRGR
jgi:myo-inositol-1(or 4)-monophosphatase